MKKKIIVSTQKMGTPQEINIKRFYLPKEISDQLKVKCPECGNIVPLVGNHPISYPLMGGGWDMAAYCPECCNEWNDTFFRLDVMITASGPNLIVPPDYVEPGTKTDLEMAQAVLQEILFAYHYNFNKQYAVGIGADDKIIVYVEDEKHKSDLEMFLTARHLMFSQAITIEVRGRCEVDTTKVV